MPCVFPILVVDDDPLLVDILIHASAHSFPEACFTQLYNASEAIHYIKELDGYGPKLVLLDIDLADIETGFDFLVLLQAHPEARLLPVVVLSSSQLPADVITTYSMGASSFTSKPFSYPEWKIYLSQLRLYWFDTVTTPRIWFHKEEPWYLPEKKRG